MKKTLLLLLIFALTCGAALSVYAYTRTKAGAEMIDESVNFLVLGSDQASGNTDVMILVGYRPTEKAVTLMQIPRDTYYNAGNDPVKINHLCNTAKENGKNKKSAISFVADTISAVFGIPIHGAIQISLDTLAAFVDAIGGIPMNVPISMQYRDEEQGLLIGARLQSSDTAHVPSCAEVFEYKGKWYISVCERLPGWEQYLEIFEFFWEEDGSVRVGELVK